MNHATGVLTDRRSLVNNERSTPWVGHDRSRPSRIPNHGHDRDLPQLKIAQRTEAGRRHFIIDKVNRPERVSATVSLIDILAFQTAEAGVGRRRT